MRQPLYERDLIAERDAEAKIRRNVIKSWNVRFVDADPDPSTVVDVNAEPVAEEPELTPEQEEAIRNANEIFARLEAEKAADEAVKAAEIAAALAEQEEMAARLVADESDYNATTGSYSGAYGKGEISDDTMTQAASILGEKSNAVNDLISQLQE